VKYPSIKNVAMILIAILLVGGSFVLAEYRNKQSATVYSEPTISTSTDLQNLADNTDWKRILLSNDKSATTTVKDLTKKKEDLTPVDILSRNFFARYMELRQTGNIDDAASQQDLINQVLKDGIVMAKPKAYSYTDILTRDDGGADSVKQYSNELATVLKTYSINSRNEAVIAKEAFDKNDFTILKELDPIEASYKNILNNILKISAPKSIAKIHLDLVNLMSSSIFMIDSFKKSTNDPMSGIMAVSIASQNGDNSITIFDNLRKTIAGLGITYLSSEAGSIFNTK
jgi:hypothetical protein